MKNLTPEMIEKAKAAKSAEELLALAKDNGVEMTSDEAALYFAQLSPKSGELDDDDLDAVAGGKGGCESNSSGKTIVTSGCKCFTGQYQLNASVSAEEFGPMGIAEQKRCMVRRDNLDLRYTWCLFGCENSGGWCMHWGFEAGKGVCEKS